MNDMERQIGRMVDGELSDQEQQSLLRYCELHSSWRDLALAYVESQILRRELRQFVPPRRIFGDAAYSARQESAQHDIIPPTLRGAHGTTIIEPKTDRRWPKLPRWGGPFSLAAAILLGLAMGYVRDLWIDPSYDHATATIQSNNDQLYSNRNLAADRSSSPGSGFGKTNPQESVQLTVHHPQTQELHQVDVPVMSLDAIDDQWRRQLQEPVSSELIESARRLGFDLVPNREIVRVRMSDGKRVLIPVESFEFQPDSRPIQ